VQQRVWASAQRHLGVGGDYVYGGKSFTTGSDCSYLVYRVLLDSGLDVPYRSSAALRATYQPVAASQAVAGDLVYKPGHVGVYDGSGGVIDHGSGHGAHRRPLWYSPTFLRVR
jgi:cell wall-associated NlpC family hydrolase